MEIQINPNTYSVILIDANSDSLSVILIIIKFRYISKF